MYARMPPSRRRNARKAVNSPQTNQCPTSLVWPHSGDNLVSFQSSPASASYVVGNWYSRNLYISVVPSTAPLPAMTRKRERGPVDSQSIRVMMVQ